MKDIKLIPVEEKHIETIRIWRNSPEVSEYMYTANKISKDQQLSWFNKIKEDKTCRYWMIAYDNKMLGLASITGIDENLKSCYWAFYLGDTSVRGAGIGGKVEYNVLHYVFEDLQLNKLRCEVFEFNDKVIKMHEKFGFRREAFYREHCFKNDEWQNVIGLAMLNKEWKILKDGLYEKIYK